MRVVPDRVILAPCTPSLSHTSNQHSSTSPSRQSIAPISQVWKNVP